MNYEYYNKSKKMYKEVMDDTSPVKIWKKLGNGCSIGTMNYSEENIDVLESLLQSFSEQYGEIIDHEAAKEELELYRDKGKLFIYFNEEGLPISMNGVVYDEDNVSVDFFKQNGEVPSNLYFYGLSTLKEHRGKGACHELIKFAIEYAYYNDFDLVYARTDLIGSNSEWIMQQAGLEVCMYDNKIIAEWVDVCDNVGDYRLHMWLPLKKGLACFPKDDAVYADPIDRSIESYEKVLKKKIINS